MNLVNFYDDTSDYNELFLAVHNGDVNQVNSLLEKYSAKETIRGKTLLNVATAKGHAEIVKTLLDNNASIKEEDSWGSSPLYVALAKGNVQIAEILFKHGAVLSEDSLTYTRPLSNAVREGNLEMVKLLMANGCNYVDVSKDGKCFSNCSLNLAISSGRLDIIEYLMENGVEEGATVKDDKLGLFRSLYLEGSLSTLKCLVDIGIKVQNLDEVFNGTLLFGRHDMWKYLVTKLSTINANTYYKDKQLHSSIRMGQLETVKRIVNEPSNEYDSDTYARQLAVYIAVESDNEEILKILLDAGYPFDSLFKFISPLHLAATFEHPRLVKLLLQAGADVNLQTEDCGRTPLHFAATTAQPAVVKYLLNNGADPSKTSKFGDSPLKMTLKIHPGPICKYLPVNPLVFTRLVKVTEILIRYSDSKTNKDLFLHAEEIRVSSTINNSTSESEGLWSNERGSVFRPEIVRCICNYLSEEEVKCCFQIIVEDSYYYPLELLHIMTEYTNNSKSCFDIEIDPLLKNSKCQLPLICYSKNVDNLSASIAEMIDDYDEDINSNVEQRNIVKLLKLLVCRLVLLNTNCDLTQFEDEYELINDLIELQENCEQEKIVMQRTKVNENLNFTYYDVLTNSIDKVSGYTNNETFLIAMQSTEIKFPVYADFFKAIVEIAERRRDCIDESSTLMCRVVKKYYNIRFSNSDIRYILQYLSIVDLRRLSAACS